MYIRIFFLIATVTTLFTACNHSEGESPSQDQISLNENISLWSDTEISSYRYEYRRLCFCPLQENVIVVVEEAVILEAFYTPSGTYLSVGDIERLFTVEGLFDVIQVAISSNVASLIVEYNIDYGYPELISIDVNEAIVDEEVTHVITEFQ